MSNLCQRCRLSLQVVYLCLHMLTNFFLPFVSCVHICNYSNIFYKFSADDHFTGPMDTNVVIRHDGQITWDSPAITKSSCRVDVSFFPFDAQQCRFTYGSWTYNGNQLDILNALESADLADLVENVEWEILGMPAKKNIIQYGCCADPYPDVTYTLELKRRASFYVFNLLIPCVMISFLAPLGFYLPADSGEKVSLGVTVMLALTVFQLLVAEIMPPSENVPLIGKGSKISLCLSICCAMLRSLSCLYCRKILHRNHDDDHCLHRPDHLYHEHTPLRPGCETCSQVGQNRHPAVHGQNVLCL